MSRENPWHGDCEECIHSMKTSLTILALLAVVGAPAAFAFELAGVRLPALLGGGNVFAGFVVTTLLLTVLNDYARPQRLVLRATGPRGAASSPRKSDHPLAA
jgi:hypothetical protein